MKNTILVLIAFVTFTACDKKNSSKSMTPQQVYCVWINNSNGTKTFYRCVETDEEMQQVNVQLRNENKFHTDYRKNTCSECK